MVSSLTTTALALLFITQVVSLVDSFSVGDVRRSDPRSRKQNSFNKECLSTDQFLRFAFELSATATSALNEVKYHHVAGITCREVDVNVEKIGIVTVLEGEFF